jgi:hypothetical protein
MELEDVCSIHLIVDRLLLLSVIWVRRCDGVCYALAATMEEDGEPYCNRECVRREGGILLGLHGVCVRAEKETIFSFLFPNKPIGPTARKSVQGPLLYHL